jgi:hypothetical protein
MFLFPFMKYMHVFLYSMFIWLILQLSLRNGGGSTHVPVRAWNNARKSTWGLPPPVKLERRDMTYTVPMSRKTQNKQTKKKQLSVFIHVYYCLVTFTFFLSIYLIDIHWKWKWSNLSFFKIIFWLSAII